MDHRFPHAWLCIVVALVLVVAVIFGAFAFRLYPLSAGDPADGRILFLGPSLDDLDDLDSWENEFDWEIHVMNSDESVMDAINNIGLNADDIGYAQLTDNDSFDLFPKWSPDRKRILFTSDRGNDIKSHDIYVMNADGSGVEQLTDGCSNRDPSWSPDGDRIAYMSRGEIYVMNADGSGVEQLTGTPDESCAQVFMYEHEFWASPDRDYGYYIRNEDDTVEPLTDSEYRALRPNLRGGGDMYPVWSPDGDRIAFVSYRNDYSDIYVMNVDGSGVERLTEGYWVQELSWSPDGERIVFYAYDIYVMNADGSDVVQLTDDDSSARFPSWSPDGERISFFSYDDFGIYVMNADGSDVERIGGGYMPSW